MHPFIRFATVALLAACARSTPRPADGPSLAEALADSSSPTRVYRPSEVRRPVVTPPGNAVPRTGMVSGQATLRFVVDTLGRAEASTVEVVAGSEAALARALQRALPEYRFLPAIGPAGTRVRQLVEWSAEAREQSWGYDVRLRLSTDPPLPP